MKIKRIKKGRKTLADVAPGEVFYFYGDEDEKLYLKTDVNNNHVGLEDGTLWLCATNGDKSGESVIIVSACLVVKE